ncbi:DUF6894 family protein [Methylobacterium sp. A54F]
MATRFYFDLVNGHDAIRDETGVEAADAADALAQARAVLGEMRAAGDLPPGGDPWTMVIRDRDGVVRGELPIAWRVRAGPGDRGWARSHAAPFAPAIIHARTNKEHIG